VILSNNNIFISGTYKAITAQKHMTLDHKLTISYLLKNFTTKKKKLKQNNIKTMIKLYNLLMNDFYNVNVNVNFF
jgi:hypothetical protein